MVFDILGYAIIQLPEFLRFLYDYVMNVFFGKSPLTHKKVNARSLPQDSKFIFMENEAKQPNMSKRLLKHEMQIDCIMDEIRDLKLMINGQSKKLDAFFKNSNAN